MRKFLACSLVGVVVFGGALVACSGGSSGGSQQAFCDTLKKDVNAFSDLSNQSDLTDSQSLSIAQAAFDDLANKAPSEIKGDMQTVSKAVKSAFSSASEFSSAAQAGDSSKLSDLDRQFSDQNKGIDQAEKNVEKYAKDKCGVDLSSSSSTSDSGSSNPESSSSSQGLSNLSDLSDLSQLSDLSNLSDFSGLSNLSSLASNFSDLSSLTNLSSLSSAFSSLFSSSH
jgi:hypothetical protein